MIRFHPQEAQTSLDAVAALGLLAPAELATVQQLMTDAQIRPAIALAESVHLHIKVDDTERLPQAGMEALGARLDHGREGFVKFRFPGGLNVIFSHIAVSADDLQESPACRRARPFLDHIGIDLREESAPSRAAFDAMPCVAKGRQWAHVGQGGAGSSVKCCHVEVAEKHWLFPAAAPMVRPVPIEVAYGPLRETTGAPGCDLRPGHPASAHAGKTACCPAATQFT